MRDVSLNQFPEYTSVFLKERTTYPDKIIFGLTSRCMMKCIMCHHSLPGRSPVKELSQEAWENIKPALLEASQIVCSGSGDPCLHPRFAEMISEVGRKKPRLMMHSSMNFWGAKHTDAIVEYVDDLYCSMDATTEETYSQIRVGGNFEKACNNVRKVVNRRKELGLDREYMNISYVMIPMRRNMYELVDAPQKAAELGADDVMLVPLYEIERMDESVQTPELLPRLREIVQEMKENCKKYGVGFNNTMPTIEFVEDTTDPSWDTCGCNRPDGDAKMEMFGWGKPKGETILECVDAYSHIMIHADGTVIPCASRYDNMGNTNLNSFDDIWNGQTFSEFRRGMMTERESPCRGCIVHRWVTAPSTGTLPTKLRPQDMTDRYHATGFWWIEKVTDGGGYFRWTKQDAILFLKRPTWGRYVKLSFELKEKVHKLFNDRPVQFTINGTIHNIQLFPGMMEVKLPIPESSDLPFIKIEIHCPAAYSPRESGDNRRDSRTLGLIFRLAEVDDAMGFHGKIRAVAHQVKAQFN